MIKRYVLALMILIVVSMSVSAYNSTDISKLETYYPLDIDTEFTDVVGDINLSQCSQAYVPVDAVVDEGTEKEGTYES